MSAAFGNTEVRGRGMVYVGSLAAYHGAVVVYMDDCTCAACRKFDEWDERRNADVIATLNGKTVRLVCARFDSFKEAQ